MARPPLWVYRNVFIVIAVVYFILPHDFDMAGLLGRVDDLLVAGYLYWRYLKLKREYKGATDAGQTGEGKAQESDDSYKEHIKNDSRREDSSDPYVVLSVDRETPLFEIEKKYRELARQYHPDRVHHLGPELQELAHQKMLAIQEAYEKLKKIHS